MARRNSFVYVGRKTQASLPENQVSLLINEDRTLDTFTGSQGNPTPGEGKHNLNTALGGEQDLGIGTQWTVSMWLKPTMTVSEHRPWGLGFGGVSFDTVFSFSSGGKDGIGLISISSSAAGSLTVASRNFSAGKSSIGNWTASGGLDINSLQWEHFVISSDDTNPSAFINLWQNSILLPINTGGIPDNPVISSASNSVILGYTDPSSNVPFRGNLGHIALWNTVLTQSSINEIFNPTTGAPFELDLNVNSGGYTQAANLIQYWKPGAIADINQFGNSFKTGGGHNLQNGSDFDGLTAWTVQIPLVNRVADVPA